MPSIEELRERCASFEYLNGILSANAGRDRALPRHDWWRKAYYAFPYLVGAEAEAVALRFCDIFLNLCDLNDKGQIEPRMSADDQFDLIQKFTHIIEELNARGGIPTAVVEAARKPIFGYFKDQPSMATRLFGQYVVPSGEILVKYLEKQHAEDMFHRGAIKLSPASYYEASTHNNAIRDKETLRPFVVPTFKQKMRGETGFKFEQFEIGYTDRDFELPIEMPDYYLYSLSDHIYHRLPYDFQRDAAVIIKDKSRFLRTFAQAFARQKMGYQSMIGNAVYYDPYTDFRKIRCPELSKRFRYSYQREFRLAFTTRNYEQPKLESFFLELGSMHEFADLVTLP